MLRLLGESQLCVDRVDIIAIFETMIDHKTLEFRTRGRGTTDIVAYVHDTESPDDMAANARNVVVTVMGEA